MQCLYPAIRFSCVLVISKAASYKHLQGCQHFTSPQRFHFGSHPPHHPPQNPLFPRHPLNLFIDHFLGLRPSLSLRPPPPHTHTHTYTHTHTHTESNYSKMDEHKPKHVVNFTKIQPSIKRKRKYFFKIWTSNLRELCARPGDSFCIWESWHKCICKPARRSKEPVCVPSQCLKCRVSVFSSWNTVDSELKLFIFIDLCS